MYQCLPSCHLVVILFQAIPPEYFAAMSRVQAMAISAGQRDGLTPAQVAGLMCAVDAVPYSDCVIPKDGDGDGTGGEY